MIAFRGLHLVRRPCNFTTSPQSWNIFSFHGPCDHKIIFKGRKLLDETLKGVVLQFHLWRKATDMRISEQLTDSLDID